MSHGRNYGWVPDPEHAARMLARNPVKSVAHLAGGEVKDTFLYRYFFEAMRSVDPNWKYRPQYQQRGTCVGQGHKGAVDEQMGIAWALGDHAGCKPQWVGRASVASIYAGSRVEVAGEPGRWDGSNGSWACEWLKRWGVLFLNELGLDENNLDEDEQLAVNWAALRDGVPAKYESAARDNPIKGYTPIRNSREAAAAIGNGYVITHCSDIIPNNPDSRGVARGSESGGHCQHINSVRTDLDSLAFLDFQSWGPDWGCSGIYPKDQPLGTIWIPERVMDQIFAQGDSYAIGDVEGLPSRELPDYGFANYLN